MGFVRFTYPTSRPMPCRWKSGWWLTSESRFSIAGSAMPHQLRIVGQLCYPEVTRSGEAALRCVTAVWAERTCGIACALVHWRSGVGEEVEKNSSVTPCQGLCQNECFDAAPLRCVRISKSLSPPCFTHTTSRPMPCRWKSGWWLTSESRFSKCSFCLLP